MKHFFKKIIPLLLGWLWLPALTAAGQAPTSTADDYVRPYTENFQYGANVGYYGLNWSDQALAGALQQLGGHSLRPTLPEEFVEYYGYDIRAKTFDAYVNQLGMKEMTVFVQRPSNDHHDWTVYPGCTQSSRLFSHLYEPIWNPDGTVNANNYYANYIYKLLLTYGDKVRFWEVLNEPDFNKGASGAVWLTRAPLPAEQLNTRAPFYHYVRMLRITYEVVKKYHPEAYITTGAGYPEYVDALMRYTDNPDGGAVTADYPRTGGAYFDVVSFHAYPNYALHYWDDNIKGFRYTRTSDYAANKVIDYKNDMVAVLNKYGYNGTAHPSKIITLCESNVSRRTSGDRTGSDEYQRNFGIKSLVITQKNDIRQFYYYVIGETVDAPAPEVTVTGQEEIGLMGLYENLNRDAPGAQKPTPLGHAFATTSQLLYGYQYDPAGTAALALPADVDGGAFTKNGQTVYVLWARALVDNSELATATYSFPAALNLASVQRCEWDYSVSGLKTPQTPQNIALSGSPAFFVDAQTVPPCSASGTLLREQWNNVSGSAVASIPVTTAPSSSTALPQFEVSGQAGTNYGTRLRGYLCVPQSGAYTFWVAGDDAAELYLSPDDDPAHKTRIASCAVWTSSVHDYTRSPAQKSAPIQLVAGQRYYIEALHKQGWGAGYVSVAWRLPDGVTEAPIGANRISPYVPTATPPPVAVVCSASGSLLREQWDKVSGSTVASIPVATAPTSSAALPQFEATPQTGTNYGARLRGYLCPPQSGAYTFWVAGDDAAELYLSPDDDPAHKVLAASCAVWTSSAHDFYRSPAQQSAPVQLVAGQRYYIEALHKQGWGAGYVSVAWRLPDGTTQGPIPGSQLSPFVPTTFQARTASPAQLKAAATAAALSSPEAELLAYPNPFTEQATVQFSLPAAGRASLAVYDVQGRLVRQLFAGASPAGLSPRLTLAAQGLSRGVYVLRLITEKRVLTQKLVLGR